MAAKVKRGRRIMDPERREAFKAERRQEERERIEAAVHELTSSEGWQRWVAVRSRFHTYSLCNQLLIAHQYPEATQVAGYRTWQSVGRQVRRGERGIRIMAPMSVKVRRERGDHPTQPAGFGASIAQTVAANRQSIYDGTAPGDDEFTTRTLFRSVSVFDVSQTDGAALPEPPITPIEGDDLVEYLPPLEAFGAELGYPVTYERIGGGVKGYCRKSEDASARAIVIEADQPANAKLRTLVHELAHALGVGYVDYGRQVAEVVVDSVAMIVCGTLGLDTSGETIPYIASWGDGEVDAIRTHAAKVDELAGRLERAAGVA